MRIAQSKEHFLAYALKHSVDPKRPPSALSMAEIWLSFFESVRIVDGTKEEGAWPDALLFEYGHREALPGYYGECFYLNLTRQFISGQGEDDDAMSQLVWQVEYVPTKELLALGHKSEWCDSLSNIDYFGGMVRGSPVFAYVDGMPSLKVDYYLTGI